MVNLRNWFRIAGFALFAGGIWAGQVTALEIVYPADKTFFSRSNYLVVKGGAPALDAVVIAINGLRSEPIPVGSPEYRKLFKDFLILQPEFEKGKNQVVVEGMIGGKLARTASADVFYQADPSQAVPGSYKPFVMHLPEQEALCAPCHSMNPDKAELKVESAKGNPCASCHKGMLQSKFVHGPAGVFRCTYCHQVESRPAKYQPRPGGAAVCNECHGDKAADFMRNKFVHGPVAIGECTLCHDPHGSDQPAQMTAKINTLCLGCHESVGKGGHVVRGVSGKFHPLEGPKNPANPSIPFSCASCHDPHGGQGQNFFVAGIVDRFQLCSHCH